MAAILGCDPLYLLAERDVVSYHNLIEMTMSKSDRNDSIVFVSKVLDLGVRFNLVISKIVYEQ